MVEPSCFLSKPTKIQSLQNWKKMGEKMRKIYIGENCPSSSNSQPFVFFYFLSFPLFFCLDKISSCLHSTFTLVWFLFFIFYFLFIFFVDKILHNTRWFFLFVFIYFLFYFFIVFYLSF